MLRRDYRVSGKLAIEIVEKTVNFIGYNSLFQNMLDNYATTDDRRPQ